MVWFGMGLVVSAWYGGMAVRAWCVSVLAWFGMRLVVGAWYGVMDGKNLVGGWKTVGKREDLCFSCFSLSQILN